MAIACPQCEADSISFSAKLRSSYWHPVKCPVCGELSVNDAKVALKLAAVAILPLCLVATVVLLVPIELWMAGDLDWPYVYIISSVLTFAYMGGAVWVLNAKVPLIPYRRTHETTARWSSGIVLLIAVAVGITWFVL